MNEVPPELKSLAAQALWYLLEQKPMPITRPEEAPRNGLPLPIRRMHPDDQGMVTQNYRPMAILEYVQEMLSGEMTARRLRDRKAEKGEPA